MSWFTYTTTMISKPVHIAIFTVCIFLFAVGVFWFKSRFLKGEVRAIFGTTTSERSLGSVILTDRGFMPSELTISQGSTVVFSSVRQKPFWPASNLHPSHTLYPEFDP